MSHNRSLFLLITPLPLKFDDSLPKIHKYTPLERGHPPTGVFPYFTLFIQQFIQCPLKIICFSNMEGKKLLINKIYIHKLKEMLKLNVLFFPQEVESLKMKAMMKLGAESAAMMRKRKPEEQSSIKSQLPASLSTAPVPHKKSRKSDKDGSGDLKWTKDRLYCVCKTKYDETKFYVGCDVCSNWFHGSCVGITPKMSKKLSE